MGLTISVNLSSRPPTQCASSPLSSRPVDREQTALRLTSKATVAEGCYRSMWRCNHASQKSTRRQQRVCTCWTCTPCKLRSSKRRLCLSLPSSCVSSTWRSNSNRPSSSGSLSADARIFLVFACDFQHLKETSPFCLFCVCAPPIESM